MRTLRIVVIHIKCLCCSQPNSLPTAPSPPQFHSPHLTGHFRRPHKHTFKVIRRRRRRRLEVCTTQQRYRLAPTQSLAKTDCRDCRDVRQYFYSHGPHPYAKAATRNYLGVYALMLTRLWSGIRHESDAAEKKCTTRTRRI